MQSTRDGDFAAAKTDYDAAVASLQSAIDADATLNTPVETALMGLLSSAEPVVDAYAAKLNAEQSRLMVRPACTRTSGCSTSC